MGAGNRGDILQDIAGYLALALSILLIAGASVRFQEFVRSRTEPLKNAKYEDEIGKICGRPCGRDSVPG